MGYFLTIVNHLFFVGARDLITDTPGLVKGAEVLPGSVAAENLPFCSVRGGAAGTTL